MGDSRCIWMGQLESVERRAGPFAGAAAVVRGPWGARFAIARVSSEASASLSVSVIAPSGQQPTHAPRPSQKRSLIKRALPSMTRIAPSGQFGMQRPQPLHFSSSMEMIVRLLMNESYCTGPFVSLTWIKTCRAGYLSTEESPMDIASLLEQSDFFRALSPARRRAVAAICIPKTLRKRELLFREGETGHSMYLMAQGVVQLFKTSADGKEVVIKLVRPGEIFGEVVLFQQDRFPVSACALTAMQVFLLPKRQLDLLLEDGEFRREFIGMLLAKQRYLAEQIFRLSAL